MKELQNTMKQQNYIKIDNIKDIDIGDCFSQVSKRLSPLWDVRDYVAVNPFFGFRDQKFLDVAKFMQNFSASGILPKREFFLKKYTMGEITQDDLELSMRMFEEEHKNAPLKTLTSAELLNFVKSQNKSVAETRLNTLSDIYDLKNQSSMSERITKEVSKWASAYFDEGQAVWTIPKNNLRFYSWWKSLAIYDEPFGKDSSVFVKLVRSLPEDPDRALLFLSGKILRKASLSSENLKRYFYGLFYSVMGWASHFQKIEFEASRSSDRSAVEKLGGLIDLFVIRLVYDIAILADDLPFERLKGTAFADGQDADLSYIWLVAAELAYVRNLESSVRHKNLASKMDSVPEVQAAFCIDVRSEFIRRHLESLSPKIQTMGFAGFFGMPVSIKGLGHSASDQNCPVLLNSHFEIRETADGHEDRLQKKKLDKAEWIYLKKTIQSSANSGFSFMETIGFRYIGKILRATFGKRPNIDISTLGISNRDLNSICIGSSGLGLESKVGLAYSALKNMGLTKNFAKYVFFFGHGSESANNPYSSALDCGACAGHNGKSNASLLAMILNEEIVRRELAKKGIEVPDGTIFLSGWHNTAKDDLIVDQRVSLSDQQRVELDAFFKLAEKACENCRQERAKKLPQCSNLDSTALKMELETRANDWSEIRTEWGLARNASFVVARRDLTRGVNFEGRSFLHDYDYREDSDLSTLELIMTAPMVVTNWINMQYYASTVDPVKFGAGNKVLNNVFGTIGCVQGNGGDLLGGLTEQSVWYRGDYFHEPIRLHVFIEADPSSIESIVEKHQLVKELVGNDWLKLISIDPQTQEFKLYRSNGWVKTQDRVWN